MSVPPKIKLIDLHKRFGDNVVLEGVDLEVARGESVVVIGGSGVGKSVTLKCILGLLVPDSGLDPAEAKRIALDKLAAVGLGPEIGELTPAELSGGMRKRVGLARAIAAEPEIIFFDEPTTGLDPIMADIIDKLVVKCVHGLGATALSITHDMTSARKIAHRIAMLYKGRIVWSGPTSEIDASGNPFVDQFVHGSAEGPIEMEVRAL